MNHKIENIFRELYSRVDQEYKYEKLIERHFTDFRWTVKDQFSFTDWLVSYIFENDVREDLCKFLNIRRNCSINTIVGEFLLSYSWDIYFVPEEIIAMYERMNNE